MPTINDYCYVGCFHVGLKHFREYAEDILINEFEADKGSAYEYGISFSNEFFQLCQTAYGWFDVKSVFAEPIVSHLRSVCHALCKRLREVEQTTQRWFGRFSMMAAIEAATDPKALEPINVYAPELGLELLQLLKEIAEVQAAILHACPALVELKVGNSNVAFSNV